MKYFFLAVFLWAINSLVFTSVVGYFKFDSLDVYMAFQGIRIISAYVLDIFIIYSLFCWITNSGQLKKIIFLIISIFLAFVPTFPLLQAFGFAEKFVICHKNYFHERSFYYNFCQFYGQGLINLSLNLVFAIFLVFSLALLTKIIKSIRKENS